MMTIMGKQFSKRGVSVIIAALLLIAIAVAAAVLLYVFSIGLLGSLSSSGGQQTKQQLVLEAYSWPTPGTTLTLYIRNVGSANINVAGADYFVNGVSVANGGSGASCVAGTAVAVNTAVPPTGSCTVALTVPGLAALTSGAAYPVKVVTPDGAVFSYSAIDGQAS